MGTLGLATPGLGQSMEQALVWARRYGVMTVVDLNWRSLFWPRPDQARDRILPFIHAVDILKLNQEEADWLFHTQAASQILPTLDRAQLVLVTGGAAGCWYATPTSEGHVPSFAVPCLETTGAGDAFLAGLLHALCQSPEPTLPEGERLVRAIRYANATGALTTTQAGAMAAQPRPEAVDNLLHTGGFLG
jgi:fructokinase